ncbi:MAG: flap endonuclease-1 [Candidatus Micrarchaeaceae archaeon]
MAVDLGKFVAEVKKPIEFEDLAGKTIAIDAYNTIYQFLSIIRGPDGSPLMDSNGKITSHLSGLMYRTTNLIGYGINPVFIFDGIPPELKRKTLEARAARRRAAEEGWQKAKESGMLEEARAHAVASTKINKEIVESSKELLGLMGIPYIQAPSEGEAQAAHLVRKGIAYASASQDYDSFLFGADTVIRNFTLTGKRKLPKRNITVDVKLERIFLKDLLQSMGISLRQLVWLGILIGTDFDEGIRKVGPKTALKIVKELKSIREIEEYVKAKYGESFDADAEEVERVFTEPDVIDMSESAFRELMGKSMLNREKLVKFMCDEHGFSPERISKYAEKLYEARQAKGQKGIGNWIR